MTENEAIDILEIESCYECAKGAESAIKCDYEECCVKNAMGIAIRALEEIQQYRAIGTVEGCREAVEKQKVKKPIRNERLLDWSDKNDKK